MPIIKVTKNVTIKELGIILEKGDSIRVIEAKNEPIAIGKGFLVGVGKDANGNRVAKFKNPAGKSFSIQTNGNLPKLHSAGLEWSEITKAKADIAKEVLAYLKENGKGNKTLA